MRSPLAPRGFIYWERDESVRKATLQLQRSEENPKGTAIRPLLPPDSPRRKVLSVYPQRELWVSLPTSPAARRHAGPRRRSIMRKYDRQTTTTANSQTTSESVSGDLGGFQ